MEVRRAVMGRGLQPPGRTAALFLCVFIVPVISAETDDPEQVVRMHWQHLKDGKAKEAAPCYLENTAVPFSRLMMTLEWSIKEDAGKTLSGAKITYHDKKVIDGKYAGVVYVTHKGFEVAPGLAPPPVSGDPVSSSPTDPIIPRPTRWAGPGKRRPGP